MTGSLLFNRQYSSTEGYSKVNKTIQRKLRRCSSADENNSFEITPNENFSKTKLFPKTDPISSDSDSGIEDFDQQIVNTACSQTNNVDEDESSPLFGACEDEDSEEHSTEPIFQQVENFDEQSLQHIHNDLELAARIKHDEKKAFCTDTSVVFHAEFARLVSLPISLDHPGLRYHLFVEDGMNCDPCEWINFACVKLDNAKAQFKCPNPSCRRLWTSMRARISFKISYPGQTGFVVLKIYGQNCQSCKTPADALWYMEEVCRVIDNLSKSIFQTFFPSKLTNDYLENTNTIQNFNKYSQRLRHDPNQRKGKMVAPHDKNHCEACQRGWCFN